MTRGHQLWTIQKHAEIVSLQVLVNHGASWLLDYCTLEAYLLTYIYLCFVIVLDMLRVNCQFHNDWQYVYSVELRWCYGACYAVPLVMWCRSSDDPFMLYAALYFGRQMFIVTNDELRDHRFVLGPDLASRLELWQRQRQITFSYVAGKLHFKVSWFVTIKTLQKHGCITVG